MKIKPLIHHNIDLQYVIEQYQNGIISVGKGHWEIEKFNDIGCDDECVLRYYKEWQANHSNVYHGYYYEFMPFENILTTSSKDLLTKLKEAGHNEN